MSQVVYTYQYDADYEPAMPIVDIRIGRAMAEVSLTLTSLVDSGADATMIPIRYLQQVHARRSRKKWMRGATGGANTGRPAPNFLTDRPIDTGSFGSSRQHPE